MYSNLKLDARDEDGDTMLHVAVKSSSLTIVELLIRAGADVNAQDVCWNHESSVGGGQLSLALREKLRI